MLLTSICGYTPSNMQLRLQAIVADVNSVSVHKVTQLLRGLMAAMGHIDGVKGHRLGEVRALCSAVLAKPT